MWEGGGGPLYIANSIANFVDATHVIPGNLPPTG